MEFPAQKSSKHPIFEAPSSLPESKLTVVPISWFYAAQLPFLPILNCDLCGDKSRHVGETIPFAVSGTLRSYRAIGLPISLMDCATDLLADVIPSSYPQDDRKPHLSRPFLFLFVSLWLSSPVRALYYIPHAGSRRPPASSRNTNPFDDKHRRSLQNPQPEILRRGIKGSFRTCSGV